MSIEINAKLRALSEAGRPLEYVIYDRMASRDVVLWEADDPDRECIVLCGPDIVDELVRDHPSIKRGYAVPKVVFDMAQKMLNGESPEPLVVKSGGDPVLIGGDNLVVVTAINEGQS